MKAVYEDGLPATILQPTIVYGPFSRPWTDGPADMLRFGTVMLADAGKGICNAVYVVRQRDDPCRDGRSRRR